MRWISATLIQDSGWLFTRKFQEIFRRILICFRVSGKIRNTFSGTLLKPPKTPAIPLKPLEISWECLWSISKRPQSSNSPSSYFKTSRTLLKHPGTPLKAHVHSWKPLLNTHGKPLKSLEMHDLVKGENKLAVMLTVKIMPVRASVQQLDHVYIMKVW